MLNHQAEPDPELVFRQSSQEGKELIEMVLISMEDVTLVHTHHSLFQAAGLVWEVGAALIRKPSLRVQLLAEGQAERSSFCHHGHQPDQVLSFSSSSSQPEASPTDPAELLKTETGKTLGESFSWKRCANLKLQSTAQRGGTVRTAFPAHD